MLNPYHIPLQLINITVKHDEPIMTLLPDFEGILDGVTELLIQFRNVSDVDATTFELHVLGCVKGKSLYSISLQAEIYLRFQTTAVTYLLKTNLNNNTASSSRILYHCPDD